jgi:hypothetical protein
MPRRSNADTIEKPDARATELGDLDDNGLERLPYFEPSSKVSNDPDFSDSPTQAREAQLAELDARDERLNGHSDVRPSEQCGVVAGSGPYPGKRCTYAEHPHNQPHSWEVTSEPDAELPGHVYDDAEASSVASSTDDSTGQATLPGTPEPEKDEYSIPFEGQFNGADFMAAPGIEEIAQRLIGEDGGPLAHLRGLRVRYFWKRRGGTKGGVKRLAAPVKPGGLASYALGRPQVALWLAADHCRDAHLTNEQIDALIFDKLCQVRQDPDDFSAFRITAPDFEGNILTIRRYGLWMKDLLEMGANVKQLGLLDDLEIPAEDDDQEDDDSDDDDDQGEDSD